MLEHYLKQIDRLIHQRPAARSALEAYRGLAALMDPVDPAIVFQKPEDGWPEVRREEGFPLFSREDLPVDFGVATSLLCRFFKYLSEMDRVDRAGLQRALKKTKRSPNGSADCSR